MKHRPVFSSLLLVALFLALSPSALASSTWYVNGVSGSDSNNCTSPTTACKTIGHAISLASSGDSIMVGAAIYREHLTIGFSLNIIGSGAKTTIIDGGGVQSLLRLVIISFGARVSLSKMTIQNGIGGGGIFNYGRLSINKVTVRRNTSWRALGNGYGGGIDNAGTLTINNSILSGNVASSAEGVGLGGAIFNGSTVVINNSTISENKAIKGSGGGIYNPGKLTISNSTLSGNSESGISNGGTAIFQNSIVANSPLGGNCAGTMTSNGYNLSSDNTCDFNGTGDLNNTDPKLGQLGNYGGPTQTIPLLSGSPAIDAGNPNGCTDGKGNLLKTDQRGMPRPDKEDSGGCDMGAYEEQSQPKCIPPGDRCFAFGLKCCQIFPRHAFCSSKTGYGVCLID